MSKTIFVTTAFSRLASVHRRRTKFSALSFPIRDLCSHTGFALLELRIAYDWTYGLDMESKDSLGARVTSPAMSWLAMGFVVSCLLALFLAAHNVNVPPEAGLASSIAYWFVRLSAGFLLYVGAVLLLEATPLRRLAGWPACAALAAVLTLVPFVMVVTMLDLAIGLPELEGAFDGGAIQGVFASLIEETGYLTDNHLIYCVLVTLPRVWTEFAVRRGAPQISDAQDDRRQDGVEAAVMPGWKPSFVADVEPSVTGDIRVVEAQEHYVRVQTTDGAGLALCRFRDALRELRQLRGMQVHRSYWVAEDVVASVRKSRGGMRLVLDNGQEIPVSRRFEMEVSSRFAALLPPAADVRHRTATS